MYDGDSFFTLTALGQAGLICLSLALAALCLLTVWWLGKGRSLPARPGVTMVAWLLFVWLSPQIYYTCYMLLFDGLPMPSVVKYLPGPLAIFQFLLFSDRPTLSSHSKGLLGWALIASSALQPWIEAKLRRKTG